MNIQTDPRRLQSSVKPCPPAAEEPIRAQFIHEDRLRELGAKLARNELPTVGGIGKFEFQARVRENGEKILEVYRATNAAQARGDMVTPAAQWLLDNHYLVEESTFQIKRDLPRRFYRQLPTMDIPGQGPVPRALAIAWVYVAHTDSTVSLNSFKAIAEGFQSVVPLKIGELWALPSLLRFVLIENLRRIALRVNRSRELRQSANEVADQVLGSGDGVDEAALLAGYTTHACDTSFATQLLYRLRDGSQNSEKALDWLERVLESTGTDAEETTIGEHQSLSSGNVTTGNIVRGLRLVNDIDWTVWFEDVSRIDGLLRERSDMEQLDFPSRDQYRTAIEDLARRSGLTEYEVTERAIEMAESAHAAPSAEDGGRAARRRQCRLLPGRLAARGAGAGDRLPAFLRHAAEPRLLPQRLERHRGAGVPADRDVDGDGRRRAEDHRPERHRGWAAAGAVCGAGERGRARLLQHDRAACS